MSKGPYEVEPISLHTPIILGLALILAAGWWLG